MKNNEQIWNRKDIENYITKIPYKIIYNTLIRIDLFYIVFYLSGFLISSKAYNTTFFKISFPIFIILSIILLVLLINDINNNKNINKTTFIINTKNTNDIHNKIDTYLNSMGYIQIDKYTYRSDKRGVNTPRYIVLSGNILAGFALRFIKNQYISYKVEEKKVILNTWTTILGFKCPIDTILYQRINNTFFIYEIKKLINELSDNKDIDYINWDIEDINKESRRIPYIIIGSITILISLIAILLYLIFTVNILVWFLIGILAIIMLYYYLEGRYSNEGRTKIKIKLKENINSIDLENTIKATLKKYTKLSNNELCLRKGDSKDPRYQYIKYDIKDNYLILEAWIDYYGIEYPINKNISLLGMNIKLVSDLNKIIKNIKEYINIL